MESPRFSTRSLMTLVAIVGLSVGAKIWADVRLADVTQGFRQYWQSKLGRMPDSPVSPD